MHRAGLAARGARPAGAWALTLGLFVAACTGAAPTTITEPPATAAEQTTTPTEPSPATSPTLPVPPPAETPTEPPTETPTETPTEEEVGIPELAGLSGRLLVLEADGTLTTMRPDGTERAVLTREARSTAALAANRLDHASFRVAQPTWSPDGSQVAWTEERRGDGTFLVRASADGSNRSELPIPFAAVYLAWSATSDRIAFFGNDPDDGSLQLATVDVDASRAQVVESGAPMYVDWTADGAGLAVHAHGELSIRDRDGVTQEEIEASDSFRVPTFVPDALLYAVDTEDGPVLVRRNDPDRPPVELARFGGSLALVVHPEGQQIAALATGPPGFDIVDPRAGVLDLAGNELTVIDLLDGSQRLVIDQRAVVWYWAPVGDTLVFGTFEQEGLRTLFVRWHLWDGSRVAPLGRILPSQLLASGYYPFFDQFARAMSIWEPAGRAFVYAGTDDDGRSGVWIQPVEEGVGPIWLTSGVFAAWSPTR